VARPKYFLHAHDLRTGRALILGKKLNAIVLARIKGKRSAPLSRPLTRAVRDG